MQLRYKHPFVRLAGGAKLNVIMEVIQSNSCADSPAQIDPADLEQMSPCVGPPHDKHEIAATLHTISGYCDSIDLARAIIADSGVVRFVRSTVISEDKDLLLMCACAEFCHYWTLGNESYVLQLVSDDFIAAIFHIFTDLPFLAGNSAVTDYHERLFSDFQFAIYNCMLACRCVPDNVLDFIKERTLHYARVFSGRALLANILIRAAIASVSFSLLSPLQVHDLRDLFLHEIESEDEPIALEALRGLSYLLEHFPDLHSSIATPKFIQNQLVRFFCVPDSEKVAVVSVLYRLLTSPDENAREAAVRLTDFPRIAELLRGDDRLRQLYCLVMKEVVKANTELLWQLAEGDVFDELMLLAHSRNCFLVRLLAILRLHSHGEDAHSRRNWRNWGYD
jgi:hypothetical protein